MSPVILISDGLLSLDGLLGLCRERVTVLYVWFNTTRDLCRASRDVGLLLGMDRTGVWPNLDFDCPRSDDEEEEEGELEEGVGGLGLEEGGGTPVAGRRSASLLVSSYASLSPSASDPDMESAVAATYRKFVERSLRLRGMPGVLKRLDAVVARCLHKARQVLEVEEGVGCRDKARAPVPSPNPASQHEQVRGLTS